MDYKHGGNIHILENRAEIIDFSSNINPYGPPENFTKTIIKACHSIDKYPDPNYNDIRNKIAETYDISSEYIVVGNGGIQVIHNAIEFLDFKKALIVVPTFVEYEKALKRFNKKFDYYYLKEENNFDLEIDQLLSSDLSDIDLVIVCSPNNPTGNYVKKEDLVRLTNRLNELKINILLDEAFIDFLEDDVSMIDRVSDFSNLIITRSLTKFFAVPGLRLGFLVTRNNKLIDKINKYRESWSVNIFANSMLLELFENKKYIDRTQKYIVEEGNRLYNQLIRIHGLHVFKPSVNYILFKSQKDISWKMELLKYKILIRHCNNYVGLDEKFFRIAVKSKVDNSILIKKMNRVMEAFNE